MRRMITPLIIIALLAAACGDDDSSDTTAPLVTTVPDSTTSTTEGQIDVPVVSGLIASELERLIPDATDEDLRAIAAAQRSFAVALYEVLAVGEGNLVVSPASIHIALLMAYAGADGLTAEQMDQVLAITGIPADRLHDSVNALDQLLESFNRVGEPLPNGTEQKVVLSIVNALWGQGGFGFEQDYLDLLAGRYGAGMHVVDYVTAAEDARQEINAWVAEETNERIEDLIPAGALGPMTRLVITNAVYLDASWQIPFDKDSTADGDFTLLDGSTITVPMMHGDQTAPYAVGDGWQAVDLAYLGGDLSMLVIVPDTGRFAEVEAMLAAGLLDDAVAGLHPANLLLAFPKFETRTQTGLGTVLRSMGMPGAFDPATADFSGITTEDRLFISDVIHEAFIKVDEAGTEAAAATAIIMRATSVPVDEIALDVDRPFIYVLRDRATNSTLFMGRVTNPAG
ncbi:serpin family protein [bacterium]|nr:serpin family protein [bacterium]